MTPYIRLAILSFSFFIMISCAKDFPLASQEVHKKALQPPPEGMGKVYCFGSGFKSGGIPRKNVNADININSKTWGQVKGKNYLFANLRPGKYYITGPSGFRVDPYVLDVAPNKTYFLDSKSSILLMKWSFFELDESTGRKYIYENSPSAINSLVGS